jgi:hypothetical protein
VKRRLSEEEIRIFDEAHRVLYSGHQPFGSENHRPQFATSLDTYFVESMRADIAMGGATISRATLLHRLPGLPWVVRLGHGEYASCSSSMQAYGKWIYENDGRRHDHATQERDPLGRFTAVSGISPVRKMG